MAIDNPSAKFLFGLRALGVDFGTTATLGRQWLSADEATLETILTASGRDPSESTAIRATLPWADAFWRALGTTELMSVDASAYENASIVHDLNEPIDPRWHGRFAVVHDGGTLEHVFHFPQAIRNALEMVAVGGHFTQVTVANNYTGHGFYQFSPELLFRVLSEENGFRIRALLMYEHGSPGRWFSVQDPRAFGHRVELRNARHTYLLVAAQRIAKTPLFEKWPQQSDYVVGWSGQASGVRSVRADRSVLGVIKKLIPNGVKTRLKQIVGYEPEESFAAACYTPVAELDVIRGRLPAAADSSAALSSKPI